MSVLVTTEIIVGSLLAITFLLLAFVWLRRRYVADGGPLLLCALRTEADPRWRLGLVRLHGSRLEWFSVVGPSFTAAYSWRRQDLDLGAPEPLEEQVPGLPADAVSVTGRCGALPCGLAFSPPSCMAVRAWLESSPPGFNANVA